jgi:GMP synthase (glutamine-hydrolysing)
MKTALAICHARFLDLASFEEVLAAQGYHVTYLDAGHDKLTLNGLNPAVVVTLGGPVSAYDRADYPWIDDEMRLLDQCMRASRPILAICLGAQILAQTLGARVFKGNVEIGWAPIELTEAGKQSVLQDTGIRATPVLHWHGDTFDLPAVRGGWLQLRLARTKPFRLDPQSPSSSIPRLAPAISSAGSSAIPVKLPL